MMGDFLFGLNGIRHLNEPCFLALEEERREKAEVPMPAKSKAQQMAAGAALAAKRGKRKKSDLKGASRSMVQSMSEKQLHDMASTKRKSKPRRASKH